MKRSNKSQTILLSEPAAGIPDQLHKFRLKFNLNIANIYITSKLNAFRWYQNLQAWNKQYNSMTLTMIIIIITDIIRREYMLCITQKSSNKINQK